MFRRTAERIKSNKVSPEIFINGNDYANSELLYKLDQVDTFDYFVITKNEHRMDLIAEDIYGNEGGEIFSWILMYINRVSLDDLVRHKVLKVIPLEQLMNIINFT